MKKYTLTLSLVFIVILTGCADGVAKLSDNSNITSTHFEEDLTTTSEVASILEETVSEDVSTTTTSNDNASSDTYPYVVVDTGKPPKWSGKLLKYGAEIDPTYNTFIEWAKSGGTIWRGKPVVTSEYQQPFIEWAKESKELVLPKIKKDGYHLRHIEAMANSDCIDIVYVLDEEYEEIKNEKRKKEYHINIKVFPKNDEEISLNIKELGEKQYRKDNTEDYIIDKKNCPYGECFRESDGFMCWFKYNNYLIYVKIYGDETAKFTPDLFDYFELETISLE